MIDVQIDKITDCLVERATGKRVQTTVILQEKLGTKETAVLRRAGWKFDRSIPRKGGFDVYRLEVSGSLIGLIALKVQEGFVFVDLVESNAHNIGKSGIYEGVGAHLFAIACKISLDNGCEGFVSFVAKTRLINHYKKSIGAKVMGGTNMYIPTGYAIILVDKYFGNGGAVWITK